MKILFPQWTLLSGIIFKEISQLEKIRDNLLPLLLSGELDVSEIEP